MVDHDDPSGVRTRGAGDDDRLVPDIDAHDPVAIRIAGGEDDEVVPGRKRRTELVPAGIEPGDGVGERVAPVDAARQHCRQALNRIAAKPGAAVRWLRIHVASVAKIGAATGSVNRSSITSAAASRSS